MPVEMLTYAELGEISPEARRALVKRQRLPRSRSTKAKRWFKLILPRSAIPRCFAGHKQRAHLAGLLAIGSGLEQARAPTLGQLPRSPRAASKTNFPKRLWERS
jgi:hypothetical protein